MDDSLIKSQMALARVPKEALVTTLAKEGHQVLREYVTSKQYLLDPLYIYPRHNASRSNTYVADLAFSLVVKELTLQGEKVANIDLVELHSVFFKEDLDPFENSTRLQKAKIVAINGFHAVGGRATPFLTRYEEEYIASWILRKMDAGLSFVLLGGSALSEAVDWWPGRLVAKLKEKAVSYEVAK